MTKEQIEYFKKFLTDKLDGLIHDSNETILSLSEYRDECLDPIDKSAKDQMVNMKTRIKDRESKLINKIRGALQRIEDGVFGICDVCEEEISIERLKARPVASRCIECKTREEMQERVNAFKAFPN